MGCPGAGWRAPRSCTFLVGIGLPEYYFEGRQRELDVAEEHAQRKMKDWWTR